MHLVVQMGHCFRRTGATGTTGEQAFTSAVGALCERLLSGRGGWTVKAILADASLSEYRGDAFIAVHCDGSLSTAAHGASVGYRTPEGQALGQAWKRAYAARGWEGFRVDNYTTALSQYYGTGNATGQGNRRAFILEAGFLTNPEDRAVLHAADGPERVVLAIADALGIPVAPKPPVVVEPPVIIPELEAHMTIYAKGSTKPDIWCFTSDGAEVTGRHVTAAEWGVLSKAEGVTLTSVSQAAFDALVAEVSPE